MALLSDEDTELLNSVAAARARADESAVVLGVGIHWESKKVFFTENGLWLGFVDYVPADAMEGLRPAVEISGRGS